MTEVTKKRIKDLLNKFVENGHARPTSSHRAGKFIDDINDKNRLPKIAYDEDGVILLVWEENSHTLIITFEPAMYHIYNSNGEILDDQEYINGGVDSDIHKLLQLEDVQNEGKE